MHDQPAENYEWPTCGCCTRPLRHDELGRVACRLCQERAETALRQLCGRDGLYARLATVLTPGAGGGMPVSGSRTAPLPLRLEPLSLMARGGVITVLQTWQVDWHEQLGWRHPRWEGTLQQQLEQTVTALYNNLEWAASSHPAFGEFVQEVTSLVRQCERQITGERKERPIAVACPCGATLRITVSTPGARCRGCGEQYGRSEVLDLPLASRTAA
jgi:hypothetical protein